MSDIVGVSHRHGFDKILIHDRNESKHYIIVNGYIKKIKIPVEFVKTINPDSIICQLSLSNYKNKITITKYCNFNDMSNTINKLIDGYLDLYRVYETNSKLNNLRLV